MSTWFWIFLAIVLVLLVGVLLSRRATAGVDPTQLLLDPDLVARVRVLAGNDQRIAAITMLRDGTPGLSLASAKVMVDRMATPRTGPTAPSPGDPGTTPVPGEPAAAPAVPPEIELAARSLKGAGRTTAAVKLVRGHLPDLRSAKAYVERL